MNVVPIVLAGRRIRLEPMQARHLARLITAGADEELWRWTNTRADSVEGMTAYVTEALTAAAAGAALPFVTVDIASGEIIGSTRFASIDHDNRKVEIGWTWITPAFQRSYVNSEAKYLMLCHAFDTWNCIRVELKTDFLNEKSRTAMLRIGATEEGTLRNHIVTYTGRLRDSTYYSVLATEWPEVRARLERLMSREAAGASK